MTDGPLLFVALDNLVRDEQGAFSFIEEADALNGNFAWKVNLDYLLLHGIPAGVRRLPTKRALFCDTKTMNGTRTMSDIGKMLVDEGVDYFNVWALADDQLVGAVKATEGTKTKVLGVTVLTHHDEVWCLKFYRRPLLESVLLLAGCARERGCHGIVLPGTCLSAVRDTDLITVVPGIRTSDFRDERHKQEVTPEEASREGASAVVCGSPIMKVPDKISALRRILARLQKP